VRPAVSVDDVSIDERIVKVVRHPQLPGSVLLKVTQYCVGHFVSWRTNLHDTNGKYGGCLEPTHAQV
jgi:hypothetical protein